MLPTAKACTTQYTKKEQLQRQDKRLAIELAIVKAKAVSGETDLRWIEARYQIADCLTKDASRKSEAVVQKILQESTGGELLQKRHAGQTQTRARDS